MIGRWPGEAMGSMMLVKVLEDCGMRYDLALLNGRNYQLYLCSLNLDFGYCSRFDRIRDDFSHRILCQGLGDRAP